jgi:hypothetical protein
MGISYFRNMITPRKLLTGLFAHNRDALLVALAGFVMIQILSQHSGIGMSPDSIVYLSTAQNIHDHGLINDYSNQPMMDFPAGYPIFLSGIIFLTGHSVPWFGPVLNGLLFGLLIWLCGWLMDRFSHPARWYKWTILIFILLSPCLLEIYTMIWSETLFLVLSVLFMIGCHRYFERHSISALLTISVIAGLSCVTRYAGISILMMGVGLMLCDGKLRWGLKKIGHLFLFGAIAVIIPALNVYRNYRLTETFTGYREKAIRGFAENLHDTGTIFCDWLPFFDGKYSLATFIAILFLLGIPALLVYRLAKKKKFFSYDTIAISYFVSYSAFILYTASVSRFQQLDSRLLSPLFLPWLWGSTAWIPSAVARLSGRPRRIAGFAAVTIAAACFLYGERTAFLDNWEGIKYAGIPGYTEDSWRESPTMAYVKTHKAAMEQSGTIYSSATDGIWFLTGVRAELMPHKETQEDIDYMMRHDHFIVVWFDDSYNIDLIDIPYIKSHKQLDHELHFADGAIYYFRTPATAPALPHGPPPH